MPTKTFNKNQLLKVIHEAPRDFHICYLQQENVSNKFFLQLNDPTHDTCIRVVKEVRQQLSQLCKSKGISKIQTSDILVVFFDRINKIYGLHNNQIGHIFVVNNQSNLKTIRRYLKQEATDFENDEELCPICFETPTSRMHQCVTCFKNHPCTKCFVSMVDVNTGKYTCPFCRDEIQVNSVYLNHLDSEVDLKEMKIVVENMDTFSQGLEPPKNLHPNVPKFLNATEGVLQVLRASFTEEQSTFINRGLCLHGPGYILKALSEVPNKSEYQKRLLKCFYNIAMSIKA